MYIWKTDRVHFDNFGIRCAANGIFQEIGTAHLEIRSLVKNDSENDVHIRILHRLYDAEGNLVLFAGTAVSLEAGKQTDSMCRPKLENPHLWTPKSLICIHWKVCAFLME